MPFICSSERRHVLIIKYANKKLKCALFNTMTILSTMMKYKKTLKNLIYVY